jgi:trigger factor
MVAETKIKELDDSAVELTVTIPQTEVAQVYDKTVQKYCKTLQVKGFRKGKAPASVLELKYGEALKEETMYSLIEDSVEESLKEVEDQYKPLPYSTPKLVNEEGLVFDAQADFSFAVSYDVYPAFETPAYEGLSITIPDVTVGEAEVAAELAQLQEQNSMIVEKTGAIEEGDIVTIDYAEIDEKGEVVEDTAREDFVFTVGTGYNFYKIDDQIIGMVKDEEKIIEKTYGEDHDVPEYVGKTISIKALIKAVKVKTLPELDDEFAQDVSDEYESLEDLKKATVKKLEETLDTQMNNYKANKLYDAILESVEVAIPESMIQAELENTWRRFASQSGMSEQQLSDLLGYQGRGKSDLLQEWKPQARRSILIQMLLEKVSEEKEIEVSDEDIADVVGQLESIDDQEQKDYYTYLMKEEKKSQKVIDLLLENNEFKTGDAASYTDFMQNKVD